MSTHEDGVLLGTFVDDGDYAFLSDEDRRRHLYILGKTGTGKSTLIRAIIASDLARGRGVALLDPHGDLAEEVAGSVPEHRFNDLIYVDPADPTHHVGFNPLQNVPPDQRPLVAAHVVAACESIWNISIDVAPRLTYILSNGLRLLLDTPGSTLLGLQRLLVDDDYRRHLLTRARDPMVCHFWEQEFAQLSERDAAVAVSSVQNKIGMLLAPPLRNMLGQPQSTINIRRIIDEGKVLIVNLSKGKLGSGPTHLLGALFVTAFAQAAEGRSNVPEERRRDFTLFADEFQHFASESFVSILSEARKWHLNLVLSHQLLGQLPSLLRQAVIGNAGSLVVFRIGGEDSTILQVDMRNHELVYDQTRLEHINIARPVLLTDTPNFFAWTKLLEEGAPTDARLVSMFGPVGYASGRLEAVRQRSRARYARPREMVEDRINRFLQRNLSTP